MKAIIVAIYDRPELTKIVLDYYREKSKKYGFEVIVVGSEGEKSRRLAKGFHYVEVPNSPLSYKNNYMVWKAKELNVDGVILIGSDDLLSDNLLKFYMKQPNKRTFLGMPSAYFYSIDKDELIRYHSSSQSIGAGRYFSRYVLEKVGWKLWQKPLDSKLDTDSLDYLSQCGIKESLFTVKDSMVLDIKYCSSSGCINITKFEVLKDLSEPADINLIEKYFGKKLLDKIRRLK